METLITLAADPKAGDCANPESAATVSDSVATTAPDSPELAAKRKEIEAAVADLAVLLAKQPDERMQGLKVWVNRVVPDRGLVYLGMALGASLGCSPFCGCAAKQIGEQCEPFLLERVPWLTRVVVEAQAPEVRSPGKLMLKLL